MMYKFEFTEKEANLILHGLGQLPAAQSFDLITKLKLEAERQIKSLPELENGISSKS